MANDDIVPFSAYATQRENPDFVRDFNLACARQPFLNLTNTATGDQISVPKGFLDSMFFDQTSVLSKCNNEDDNQEKYAFLASDESLDADSTDFSDPAAILRRQRLILEQITTHEANKNANFDPLKLLRKSSATVGGEEEKNEPISQ